MMNDLETGKLWIVKKIVFFFFWILGSKSIHLSPFALLCSYILSLVPTPLFFNSKPSDDILNITDGVDSLKETEAKKERSPAGEKGYDFEEIPSLTLHRGSQ